MRHLLLWRQWGERRRRTSSSSPAHSAGTGGAARTASGATCPKPHLATEAPRNSRWTTPNGRRGSETPTTTGRVYRSRSAADRLARVRRIAGDIAAIVLIICAMILLLAGIVLLASMIGALP